MSDSSEGTEPAAVGELRVFTGTVDAPANETIVAWSDLEVDGADVRRAQERQTFKLKTDAGDVITVLTDGPPHRELLESLPVDSRRDVFYDMLEDPLVRMHGSGIEPGPEVKASVRGARLLGGAEVTVVARVESLEPGQQRGDYRSEAALRVARVRALRINAGSDTMALAERQLRGLQPKPPRPTRKPHEPAPLRVHLTISAVATILIAIAAVWIMPSSGNLLLLSVAAALLSLALMLQPAERLGPWFFLGKQNAGPFPLVVPAIAILVVGAVGLMVAMGSNHGPLGTTARVVLAGLPGVIALTSLVYYAVKRRPHLRATRELLAERAGVVTASGKTWSNEDGFIECETTQKSPSGLPVALARVMVESPDERHADVVRFKNDSGQFEIELREIAWASNVFEARKADDDALSVRTMIVPVGSRVLVAGWKPKEGARMRSTGPQSLFLFASADDTPPREILSRSLRVRRWLLAVSVVIASLPFAGVGVLIADVGIPVINPDALHGYRRVFVRGVERSDACVQPGAVVGLMASTDDRTSPVYVSAYDGATGGVIPFPVQMFGTPAGPVLTISTNGWLSLLPNGPSGLHGSIPNRQPPNLVIAPFWMDLITRTRGICLATAGTAPHRRWVAQWDDVTAYGSSRERVHLTFQIILHEAPPGRDNVIELAYPDMHGTPGSATIGIEDLTGTVGRSESFFGSPSDLRYVPRN